MFSFTIVLSFGFSFQKVPALTNPPVSSAESAVIFDVDSKEVIYGKNAMNKHMIASTTKVMTAILAYENLEMDQVVTIGAEPPYAEGSSMGFKENEEVMVIDLLYALILHSANDAAEALAEAVDGSIEKFAERMTERAHAIGATDTVFHNPSGLTDSENPENNNFTTAKDLSLITAEVLKYEELLSIGQKKSHMLPLTNLLTDTNRWATNKNQMLYENNEYYYEPILFGKTGWTPDAGYSWTAIAEKDGRTLILTFLKAANQASYWQESKSMLEWAFEETEVYTLYEKGQLVENALLNNGEMVPLYAKEDFRLVSGKNENPMQVLDLSGLEISKNYEAGQTVHVAKVKLNNQVIGELELVCEDNINLIASEEDTSGVPETKEEKSLFSHPVFKVLFTVVLGVLIIAALLFLMGMVLRQRRRRVRSTRMSSKRMQYLKQLEESRKA